jgi:hypothetical protein
MKTPDDNRADKRISSLLSAADRRTVEPDRQFLDALRAKSTAEFLACGGSAAGSSEDKARATSLWRIVMKSRTKLAAAATIVLAALVCRSYFGGSVELTTIAFAEISEAMRNVPWMHAVSRGRMGGENQFSEEWTGFEANIRVFKHADGEVTFQNMKEHRSYRYSPEDRTITVDYIYNPLSPEGDFPFELSSLNSLVDDMLKSANEMGAEITTKEIQYNGQQIQLQEISLSVAQDNQNLAGKLSLYIQPQSRLPLAVKTVVRDSEGNIVGDYQTAYSYPPTGPSDIYAVGVPDDAAIVSNLPKEDYQTIWDSYRQSRAAATTQYVAVVTHTTRSLGDVITMVDLDRKSGRNHRLERHFVCDVGERPLELWSKRKEQLGDSLESLLAWANTHYDEKGHISLHIYDGTRYLSTRRDREGSWSKPRKATKKLMPEIYLQCLGWPFIGKAGRIIEDDYSRQNNLICIERLQQGSLYSGVVSLPGRFVYYLDPQKDYICRRKITEWRPDAEWQKNKSWLDGMEPDKIRNGSIAVHDITEIIQAPNGHWYPRVIVERQSGIRKDYKEVELKVRTVKRIYLQTDPEFPDDVFSAEKLPGQ